MTPVPDSQSLIPASEPDAPHDFVSETYGSVWEEHTTHHVEHCLDSLVSLQRPHPRRRRPPPRRAPLANHPFRPMAGSGSTVNFRARRPQFESFTIYEYETTNNVSPLRVRKTKAFVLNADPFPPYPSYDACAPLSRNIMVGDDPDRLPFIPFADDPTYDYELDIGNHSYFAWPNLTQDPDSNYLYKFRSLDANSLFKTVQIIILETVRRLVSEFGLSLSQIAEMKIFPLSGDEIIKVSRTR